MYQDPIALIEECEDKVRHLGKLSNEIFMHGFSSPLTPLHKVRSSDKFQALKQEVRDANDFYSSYVKGRMKLDQFTPSLSETMLSRGHNEGKNMLRQFYMGLKEQFGSARSAFELLPHGLNEVIVDRQRSTFYTQGSTYVAVLESPHSETCAVHLMELKSREDLKISLFGIEGGMSGKTADMIKGAIKNMRTEVMALCEKPKAELLFEQLTKAGRGFHL